MNYFPQLIFVMVLLIGAAFFAASETALFSLSSIQRRRLNARHKVIGGVVNYLLDRPRRTLIALLIGTNIIHILSSAVLSVIAINIFGDEGVGLVIGFYTIVLIIFGEIIPKTIAVRNNETISALVAIPLQIFTILIAPLRRIVRWLTDCTLGLIIRDKNVAPETISDRELHALIEIGEEEGVLDKSEAGRLERLFALEERSVREIMTPRPDLVAFDIQDSREELANILRKYHYTYLPVYQETVDNILGVISTQEVMLQPSKSVRDLLKPSHYVPETKRIDELLFEMKKSRNFFAICVDEYGGTAGLVTLEDILEEVFGEIYDEYAKQDTRIMKLGKDEFLVDGRTTLKDLNESLNSDFHSEESDTVSGFVLEKLGRIPKPKETFKLGSYFFEIREIEKQRIAKVLIRKTAP